MSEPQFQIPPQLLQAMTQQRPQQRQAEVVEILSNGMRLVFALDGLERVYEHDDGTCSIQLRGGAGQIQCDLSMDDFLTAAKVQPRQLYGKP